MFIYTLVHCHLTNIISKIPRQGCLPTAHHLQCHQGHLKWSTAWRRHKWAPWECKLKLRRSICTTLLAWPVSSYPAVVTSDPLNLIHFKYMRWVWSSLGLFRHTSSSCRWHVLPGRWCTPRAGAAQQLLHKGYSETYLVRVSMGAPAALCCSQTKSQFLFNTVKCFIFRLVEFSFQAAAH